MRVFVVILTSLLLASLSIDISFVCVVFLLQANAWGGASGVQRGGRGWSSENDLWFYSRQSLFSTVCISDWISTPLTLVNTCQVNDIWKDGLGRVSTVHPHWTAALFKSACQHAHAAVTWLSMSLSRHTCQISLASSYFPASSSLICWYV